MRLHAGVAAYTGAASLDGMPAALRAGGPVLLGVDLGGGLTVLAHGGSARGWEALVSAVGFRGRRRAGERTVAAALARGLGDGAAAVTVVLGAEADVLTAGSHGAAEALAAEWRALDVVVAVDPTAGAPAVRMLRRARRLGLDVVVVEPEPVITVPRETIGLMAEESAAEVVDAVPASAVRLMTRAMAERAGADAAELLRATARLVARCRVDPIADLGWGSAPPSIDLTGLELDGIEHRVEDDALVVEHHRVDEAVALLVEQLPGSALLPDGGVLLDGSRVPRRGRSRGLNVAAFDRRECTELGLATIAVRPDRALSALAHARAEAGGVALSATGMAALHPAAMTAGVLEHDAPRPASAVRVLPGSVVGSGRAYRVEGEAVRAPLRTLAGLTTAEVERILAARPFRSLADFATRAAPARARLLRLAAEGALDELLPDASRAAVIATVRELGSAPAPSDEPTLFAGLDIPLPPPPPPPHAIESFRPMLDELQVVSAGELAGSRPGAEVLVAGLRVAGDRAPRGSTQLSLRLEDGSGVTDCAFPSGAKTAVGSLLASTRLVLVQGRTRETDDEHISIEAENAWDLKRMWSDWTASRRRSA